MAQNWKVNSKKAKHIRPIIFCNKIIFAEIFLHVLTRLGSMVINLCVKAIKNSVVIEQSVTEKNYTKDNKKQK